MAPRVPSSHQRLSHLGRDGLLPPPSSARGGDEALLLRTQYGGAEEETAESSLSLLLRREEDWADSKKTGHTEEHPPSSSSSSRIVDRQERSVTTHPSTADGGLAALPATTATTPVSSDPWNNNPTGHTALSLLGGLNSSMYGGALGGVGPYGASGGYPVGMGMGMGMGGMIGGGYYGGAGMALGSTSGPLASFNQFLFGVQAVIFSLGQAIQIVGMNAHALQQLLDAALAAFDRATTAYRELRSLEAARHETDDEESRKRLRRFQALRWTVVVAATYGGYRLVKRLLFQRRPPQSQHSTLSMPPSPPSYYASAQGPAHTSYPYSGSYNSSYGAAPYGGPSSGYGPTAGAGTYGPYY